MRWMVLCAVMAMAGPAGAVEDVDGTFAKLPAEDQKRLMAIVENTLPDGRSSRLKGIVRNRAVYCGEINTKNRLGAYGGYQRFQFSSTSERLTFEFGDELQNTIFKMFCR